MNKLLIIFSFLCIPFCVLGQLKYEKETRIKKKKVPQNAIDVVESMNIKGKVKWFKEEGLKTISYEAKAKQKRRRLSIEFSEEGIFEDLEIEIKAQDIESETMNRISDYLKNSLGNYQVNKIQIQYSGPVARVVQYFLKSGATQDVTVRYEIVVTGKEEGAFTQYEYLFDRSGNMIRKSEIQSSPSDNIKF